jgi:hypothetical protein
LKFQEPLLFCTSICYIILTWIFLREHGTLHNHTNNNQISIITGSCIDCMKRTNVLVVHMMIQYILQWRVQCPLLEMKQKYKYIVFSKSIASWSLFAHNKNTNSPIDHSNLHRESYNINKFDQNILVSNYLDSVEQWPLTRCKGSSETPGTSHSFPPSFRSFPLDAWTSRSPDSLNTWKIKSQSTIEIIKLKSIVYV